MSRPRKPPARDTTPAFEKACRIMWGRDATTELVALLGGIAMPSTCRAWIRGFQPPPPYALEAVAAHARQRASALLAIAPSVDIEAAARHRTYMPPPTKGCKRVMERDGPGSIPRDARRRKAT